MRTTGQTTRVSRGHGSRTGQSLRCAPIMMATLLFVSAAAWAEEAKTSVRSVSLTSVGILLPASSLGDPLQVTCLGDAWPIKSSIKLSINWGWLWSRDYRQEAATSCTITYAVFIAWDDNRAVEVGEYERTSRCSVGTICASCPMPRRNEARPRQDTPRKR